MPVVLGSRKQLGEHVSAVNKAPAEMSTIHLVWCAAEELINQALRIVHNAYDA